MKGWPVVMLLSFPLLGACKDDERCERTRLELSKSWSELRIAATRRKLEGADPDLDANRSQGGALGEFFHHSPGHLERRSSQSESRFQVASARSNGGRSSHELHHFCPERVGAPAPVRERMPPKG